MTLIPNLVQAQAPGASFPCDGKLYQTRQAAANSTTTTLYQVERTATPYTTVALRDLGVRLNAVGYNQRDSYLYAVSYANGDATAPINLYKIGQGGAQSLGLIKLGATGNTNIPSTNYAGGAIDKNGIMYISVEGGSNVLYRIDLNTITTTSPRVSATTLALPATYTFFDLAINPINSNIYGTQFEGALGRIVPNAAGTSATVADISSATAVNGGTDPVGTAFFDAAGTLLVASNGSFNGNDAGNFYIVDVTSAARSIWSFVTTLPRSAQSDGASCIFPPQKIDVVKTVGNVTRVSATQYTVPYTITVKNTATELGVDATNIQVSDFLFRSAAGDNATNITFGTAILPTAGTTPSTIENLTISDTDPLTTFTLNNTGTTSFNGTSANNGTRAGLLAAGQTLKQGFSITITFTARVRYAAGTVPSTAQLNTAIATSSSSTNPGYRLDATNGVYVPPIDLLAADQSTDGNTLPLLPNADEPSPTPVNFSASIAGTVFEDINYGGGPGRSQAASNGPGVSGVRVELYNANGTYRTRTTTDSDGFYSFGNLTAGNSYTVRVVNLGVDGVKSTRDGGSVTGLAAVQTYANGSKVGGNDPAIADPGNNSGTLPATAQSTISIAATVGNPASADFGFNFSTIVNTNSSGQGSLSQFITNSNALLNDNTDLVTSNDLNQVGLTAGVENSIFMIPVGDLTNNVAVINQTSALPAITDARTAINGKTQTTGIGNTNTATLGTGGTVGTGLTAFSKVNGPEVKIALATNIAGLNVTGNNAVITGINLVGSSGNALTISGNNASITDNVLGSNATGFVDPGNAARTVGSQISITGGNGTIISGNVIGFAGQSGVMVAAAATAVSITNNEIRSNGVTSATGDGLTLANTGTTVTNNLITANAGMGIDLAGSTGSATITGNSISSNGRGIAGTAPTETAGVRVAGSNNSLTNNILDSNYGAGILVASGASSTVISMNSTLSNGTVTAANGAVASGQLGIDLLASADDANKGTSGYFSLNANSKTAASGANGLLNFPVISRTSTSAATNGNMEIVGYAPRNSTIEFFISDKTSPAFGQGQTFLFTATEGATTGIVDASSRNGSYSGLINGLNQGSETGASIFSFSVSVNSLPAAVRAGINAGTSYITATATLNDATSEFSGNAKVVRNVAPLPVTLVAFGAQAAGLNARLNWKTAQELNNDHFVIERSFDASSFVAVGEVKGQGSTQATTSYDFTDVRVAALAPAGLVYYRLRQVDADGTESLSEVQTVRFPLTARTLMDVYPNPATAIQNAKLDLSGAPAGSYQVTLVDMTGRVLRTFSQSGGTVQELQLTSLSNGTYLVQVKGNGQSFNRRVIKQ